MKLIKKLFSLSLIVVMVFTLAACSSKSSAAAGGKAETKLDKIKKAGVLVVGTSADYPPYEFHKQINGEDKIVGFDIDIANEIAKELGVKLEIKEITFNGLLEALKSGKIDIIIAGMNPTAERAKSVDFSKVYYTAVQSVVIRTADKDSFKSFSDLKGKTVGVQMATTQEEIAKAQISGAKIKSLGKITDLVLELKNKKVDALVVESPVAKSYASKNPDLTVTDMKFSQKDEEKGSAVAAQKNSPELIDAVNKVLTKLMDSKTIDKFVTNANELVE